MARRKSRVSIELGVQSIRSCAESIRILTETKGFSKSSPESIRRDSESTPSSRFHKLPKIESIRVVSEPIHSHTDFQFDNREPRSRGACVANDSAYGNSGPSGVVSAVGSLFPRGTKTNVAAYGSGRGPSAIVPATNLGYSH
ncbi:hypothetical protein PIB30_049712 [Stylosanthes scabra]|uniref:Uncharacterized protein n=1 Tax=Stylosanthes scabra TaxID=79078 RepID=A0ABU6QGR0_9FABA|nr:hypothetical protein [Stylosanthes scabra]